MNRSSMFIMAACAVFVFSGSAGAAEKVLVALNLPVKSGINISTPRLPAPTTSQIMTGGEDSDFDALSVNDPLYREGSKELLEQISKQEAAKPAVKSVPKPALRDAPVSKKVPGAVPAGGSPAVKKVRGKKPVHSDPVKAKNIL